MINVLAMCHNVLIWQGFSAGSSDIESHPDDVIQEETVGSIQQSKAAMALCSEVKADVKNLQSEMNALKEMVTSLHDKREESSAKGKGKQQKLPAGLSVSVKVCYCYALFRIIFHRR